MHEHQPRKRFSQNFLQDESVIQSIIDAISPRVDQKLIEIGPGLGALTKPLLAHYPALTAIELDRDLVAHLKQYQSVYPDFNIISGDALTVDFNALKTDSRPLRVVGNLPYMISTPLIFHLLQFADGIEDMYFMLQKEVVDRMVAAPGSKAYGRLSVMLQVRAEAMCCFLVPPEAFHPAPKVMSAVVCIRPFKVSPYPAFDKIHFADLVTTAFSHRRKSIRNAMKDKVDPAAFEALEIDSNLRPENLSVLDFVRLANY